MPGNLSVARSRVRIAKKLARIRKEAPSEVRGSLQKSGIELAAMQRRLVPVDEGDTKESIRVMQLALPKIGVLVIAGSAKAFYARWVEFGTQKTPAQPFFWPAYRALRKKIKKRTRKAVKLSVQRIWRS